MFEIGPPPPPRVYVPAPSAYEGVEVPVVRFEPSHAYPSDPVFLKDISTKELMERVAKDQEGLDSLMAARALSSRVLRAYYTEVAANGGADTKETLALAIAAKNMLLAHLHFENSQKLDVHAKGDTNHEAMLREMMAASSIGGQDVLPPHQPAKPDQQDLR